MARRSEASDKPAEPDAQASATGDEESAAAPVEQVQKPARPPAPQSKPEVDSAAAPSGAASSPDAEPSPWWLRRSDQAVLALLCALCLVLMGWYQLRLSGWGRRPIEIRNLPQREVDYRIDINRASWVEFAQLPRIGRTLAERIVEDRERNGPFESIEDLQRVRGIGAKTIERIRPLLQPVGVDATSQDGPNGAP
jgi:competence protein ComEA